MRVSDVERQRTIDELRRHCAAGRIDVDEYAARIEKAMSATSLEELDRLRADLPMMRIADPDGGATGRVWARAALPESPPPPDSRPAGGPGAPSTRLRFTAAALVVLTAMVVAAVLVLSLVAEWAWAAVLLAGWLVGLLQGRLSTRARRRN